jgi:hypothetical protein
MYELYFRDVIDNALIPRLNEVEASSLCIQIIGDGLSDQGDLTSPDCYN